MIFFFFWLQIHTALSISTFPSRKLHTLEKCKTLHFKVIHVSILTVNSRLGQKVTVRKQQQSNLKYIKALQVCHTLSCLGIQD